MKKFNLGESKVCFDNNFEFYHPIYISMIEVAQKSCDDFKEKLDSIKDLDELMNKAVEFGNAVVDSEISFGVDTLIANDIFDWDSNRLKDSCGINAVFEENEEYKKIYNLYLAIVNENSNVQEEFEEYKANRGYWTGGGFGISGAITGAIKASALNFATDSLRGIGDHFRQKRINKYFAQKKQELLESGIIEDLFIAAYQCTIVIIQVVASVLEKKSHVPATAIKMVNADRSEALFNNLDRISDTKKRLNVLAESITLSPYSSEGISYALNHIDELNINVKEIDKLGEYLIPSYYKETKPTACFDNLDLYEKSDGELDISRLKRRFYLFGYVDEAGLEITGNDYTSDVVAHICTFLLLSYELLKVTRTKGQQIKTYAELLEYKNRIYKILADYKIYDESKQELNEERIKLLSSMIDDGDDQLISRTLLEIETKEKELSCKEDGIEFNSLEEANIYRQEKPIFNEIFENRNPYSELDSKELSSLLYELEKPEFKSIPFINIINELKEKLKVLVDLEKSTADSIKSEIINIFKEYTIPHLYLYGDEGFIERAIELKPRLDKKYKNYEKYIIPVAIYDNPEEDKIVFSESTMYTFHYYLTMERTISSSRNYNELRKVTYDSLTNSLSINYAYASSDTAIIASEKIPKGLPAEAVGRLLQRIIELNVSGSAKEYIYCTNCGMRIPADSNFCPNCGTPTT